MLHVLAPEEARALLLGRFSAQRLGTQSCPTADALGRTLADDAVARDFIPGFDRSTVDGYAVHAADTFGAGAAIPALLILDGSISMGSAAVSALGPGRCMEIPTGGALPAGADAVVMLEYAEPCGDGTVAVVQPVAPGCNLIHRGEDARPGARLLRAGQRLNPQDLGALAAAGVATVTLRRRPVVGILSTGDELVEPCHTPGPGQVRDVNAPLLAATAEACGCAARRYGIVPDAERTLGAALDRALAECDCVLLSGGSSVGAKDAAARVLAARGELLFHGLAMKPGKPTLAADVGGKPVLGLPGHPAAAHFVAEALARPLLCALSGACAERRTVCARLSESFSSNHGRTEYLGVALEGDLARPIRGKSGLITALAGSDGYICIPRDCEGLPAGSALTVFLYD